MCPWRKSARQATSVAVLAKNGLAKRRSDAVAAEAEEDGGSEQVYQSFLQIGLQYLRQAVNVVCAGARKSDARGTHDAAAIVSERRPPACAGASARKRTARD